MLCTIFVEPVNSTVSTPKKNEMHSDVHVSLSTSNSKSFMGIILIIVDKELYDFLRIKDKEHEEMTTGKLLTANCKFEANI